MMDSFIFVAVIEDPKKGKKRAVRTRGSLILPNSIRKTSPRKKNKSRSIIDQLRLRGNKRERGALVEGTNIYIREIKGRKSCAPIEVEINSKCRLVVSMPGKGGSLPLIDA